MNKLIEMKRIVIILLLTYSVPVFSQQPLFIWPLKAMDSYSEVNNYYVINNFIDSSVNPMPTDWNCGSRTYAGHTGIDIDPWPFTWSMMENEYVAVLAAAPGRVAEVQDNNDNDENCLIPPANVNANYITIRHADSSTSVYVHIKDNSARVVVGQMVAAGEIIAFVGSSGRSSHPHLHFEVHRTPVGGYGSNVDLVDPYVGNCNMLNANTWWQNQKPYWEPAILRVMTHFATPSLIGLGATGTCKSEENKNARAAFVPFDNIYFGIAMRDFLMNQFFTINVYYPNGNLWFSEPHANVTGSDQVRRYTVVQKNLGNAPSGTYKVEVDFYGSKAYHFFTVNCPSSQPVTGPITGYQGFKASGTITSTATVTNGNRLFLQAGTRITLSTGFSASGGSTVKARIRDCNYSE
jgi:murein DD-endopeptidase MepM/ murein hydrolase activator NlpD